MNFTPIKINQLKFYYQIIRHLILDYTTHLVSTIR